MIAPQTYRSSAPVEACRCRGYPPGTVFQELDDDPGYYRGESDDLDDYGPGKRRARTVRMQHSQACVDERRADARDALARLGKRRLTRIVACGSDYADGAWWVWV